MSRARDRRRFTLLSPVVAIVVTVVVAIVGEVMTNVTTTGVTAGIQHGPDLPIPVPPVPGTVRRAVTAAVVMVIVMTVVFGGMVARAGTSTGDDGVATVATLTTTVTTTTPDGVQDGPDPVTGVRATTGVIVDDIGPYGGGGVVLDDGPPFNEPIDPPAAPIIIPAVEMEITCIGSVAMVTVVDTTDLAEVTSYARLCGDTIDEPIDTTSACTSDQECVDHCTALAQGRGGVRTATRVADSRSLSNGQACSCAYRNGQSSITLCLSPIIRP